MGASSRNERRFLGRNATVSESAAPREPAASAQCPRRTLLRQWAHLAAMSDVTLGALPPSPKELRHGSRRLLALDDQVVLDRFHAWDGPGKLFGPALFFLTADESRELYGTFVGCDADGKAAGLWVVEQLGLYPRGDAG